MATTTLAARQVQEPGSVINSASSKTTPVDADHVGLMDSAASNVLKKLSWANIKATSKVYFDTLYPAGSGNSTGTNTGDQTRITLGIDKRTAVADAAYTILSTDKYVALASITASRIFTLPAANSVNAGYEIIIADESGNISSTITLTLNRAGSDLIDGTTSEIITSAYGFRRFISDGSSKWTFDGGVVRLGATQTLTNKTLTAPIITTGLKTSGSAPSIAAGTGMGTSPSGISVTGNDIAGYISFTTGTSPATTSTIATITFNAALANTPKAIMLTAANANNQIGRIYVDQVTVSTTIFVLKSTATALSASSAYIIYYLVIQ